MVGSAIQVYQAEKDDPSSCTLLLEAYLLEREDGGGGGEGEGGEGNGNGEKKGKKEKERERERERV